DEHGLVLSSVASLDYDDNAGVLERTATKNTYDQHDNLLRTDVLVTDNGHNDEFRSQSSAISEYDDRGRITRRVLDTEVRSDQHDNLLRTDVLVTDNGHNDEFRSQSSAISEYDDRGRITRRVLDTEV